VGIRRADNGCRFEREEPVTFDYQEQDSYNREAGVPVEVYQQYDRSWTNLLLASHLYEPRSSQQSKPWWKFW